MSQPKRRVMIGRREWWSQPVFVAIVIAVVVAGSASTLYVHFILEWTYATFAVAFFWAVVLIIAYLGFRQLAPEPVSVIDRNEMAVIKDDIRTTRIRVRKDLADMERSLLEQGKRAPVLDAWRLDPSYASIHTLIGYVDTSEVDPGTHELLLRLQLDELDPSSDSSAAVEKNLLRDVSSLLWMAARDPYYLNIRRFIERVILEVYSTREDEHHVDVPYPILSLELSAKALAALRADGAALRSAADLRFNGGNDIEPHRGIPSTRMARGAK